MPSTSEAQAKLMRAIAHGWHKPGGGGPSVSVAREFVAADKAKSALRTAKKYADGGEVEPNEWEDVPRSPEGRPQITITKPPAIEPPKSPGELVSHYARKAADWFKGPEPNLNRGYEPPQRQDFQQEPGQEAGNFVRNVVSKRWGELTNPFVSEEDKKYYEELPLPPEASKNGKVVQEIKDPISRGMPIVGEVVSNLAGPPGKGAAWGLLKGAAMGMAGAAAKTAAKAGIRHGFMDTAHFKPVSLSKGTMPGGFKVDPATGAEWYVKQAPSLEHAKNEKLTAELYKLFDVPVADVQLTTVGGKPGIASKKIEGVQLGESNIEYRDIKGLHENYVIDALLGNHDKVGTGPENSLGNVMVDKSGVGWTIDTGGGLTHKGTGAKKTSGFTDDVTELDTMKDPSYSHLSAEVFGGVNHQAAMAGAQKIANVSGEDIAKLIELYGPENKYDKMKLMTTLLIRKHKIEQEFGVTPRTATNAGPKPSEPQPVPTKDPYEQIPFTEEEYEKFGKEIPAPAPDDFIPNVNALGEREARNSKSYEPISGGYANSWLNAPKEAHKLLEHFKVGPGAMASDYDTKGIGQALAKIAQDYPSYGDMVYFKLPSHLETAILKEYGPAAATLKAEKQAKLELKARTGDFTPEEGKDAAINKLNDPIGIEYLKKDALKPIEDWPSWKPPKALVYKPRFESPSKGMLAKQRGFNLNFEIHKGGRYDPDPLNPNYPKKIIDPAEKEHEPAWFASDEILESNTYGPGVVGGSYIARANKAFEMEWPEVAGSRGYDGTLMHNAVVAARQRGADLLAIHGIVDQSGEPHTQYAIINTAVLRAPNAKFDKKLLHQSFPMAGLAGGGLFTYGAISEGQEKDKMNRGGIPALLHKAKTMARGGSLHPRHPAGMIKSSIPGRTDKIPMSVPPGSYILPADVPSALGEGNTMAGEKILGTMFRSGPSSPGSTGQLSGKLPRSRSPRFMEMKRMRLSKFADGGETEQTTNEDIPIIAAGGEYVIHPEQVAEIGHGDMKAGHRVLDQFVLSVRKRHIETLKSLKPPKK